MKTMRVARVPAAKLNETSCAANANLVGFVGVTRLSGESDEHKHWTHTIRSSGGVVMSSAGPSFPNLLLRSVRAALER
jgi:hypothetical protein